MEVLLDTQNKGVTRRLESDIRNRIASAEMKYGDKLLPERELAKKYNLSCGSVRKVLLRLVDEGLLERDGRRGTKVCVDKTANKTIVFSIFSSLSFSDIGASPYYEDIYRGMIQEAAKAEWDVVLQMGDVLMERLAKLKNKHEYWADGVILCGTDMPIVTSSFMKTSVPFVLVDYSNKIQGVNSIGPDNMEGGYIATSHLQELGHEKIGFIYPLFSRETEMQGGIKARSLGYQDAMDKAGKPVDGKLSAGINIVADYKLSGEGERALREYLSNPERPTAVFVASDTIVPEFYRIAYELQLRIPEDISVIGFEGLSFAETLTPSLTTIQVDRQTIGRLAIQRLKSILEGDTSPVRQILPAKLMERNSSGNLTEC